MAKEAHDLMTVKEVCAMLRVNRRTLCRWVKSRRLRPLKIERTLRFRRGDVLAAMDKYEFGGPEPRNPAMW